MKREEARKAINERPLTDFIPLERSRKAGRNMYVCPVCGSGTGRNGTGALCIYPDSNRVFCFANNCFTDKGEDTLGALRIIWKCDETTAIEKTGYSLDKESHAPAMQEYSNNTKHQEHNEHQQNADYTLFYRECHEALKKSPEALEYLHGRGITDESIDRFNLGYCATWKHPRSPNTRPTKRIIIPRTKESYTARMIEQPLNEWEADRKKQTTMQKALFNLEAINNATPFVVEGELDAISLYQAGASSVVALGSTSNRGRFLEEAKKHPESVYILALDNDVPGQQAQSNLANDMKEAGLSVNSIQKLYGDAKDGNEAFTKDPERLKKVISWTQSKAEEIKQSKDEEREKELRKRTGEGMLEDFLLQVTTRRDFEPLPTGINDLDKALNGGFIRKTFVLLGGAPGMGKTAIAQWIFENMATAGHDVLYINLEMSREQLIARSLSRYCWKYGRNDISAVDVLRGYEWTPEQREAINNAAKIYGRDVAPHFIYNPDGVNNEIDSIIKAMEDETARIEAQGKQAPLVCVDYLQLIDSGNRDAVEGMKEVIFRLKDFAIKNNTIVLAIMANNRASNATGTTTLESGRDTSAIEYSGDTVLGLSYTAIEDHRKVEYKHLDENGNEETEKNECTLEIIRSAKRYASATGNNIPSFCNEISLNVLKNRFGEAERRANLVFDGKHNTFYLKDYQHQEEENNANGWETITDNSDLPF